MSWRLVVALLLVIGQARAAPGDRNLDGSHTRRIDKPCTLFVAPHGHDAHDGRRPERALRTPRKAVALARPGDVVCFAAGQYRSLMIERLRATAAAPIVFRAAPGAKHEAVFSSGALTSGPGAWINRARHLHLYDVRITNSQVGVGVRGSDHIRLEGLRVDGIGQEAIHLARRQRFGAKPGFIGPVSHHCDVIDNAIADTGKIVARYGEGVYVGTGALLGDETHDIFVGYNRFEGVRAEAIELKPFTYRNIVRGNMVLGGSHIFHGAITVGAQSVDCRDGEYLIEDNLIVGYASTADIVSGICIGHGNGIVRNNVIWGIDGGRGIRTTMTFANQAARDVRIEGNLIWSPGGAPSISLDDGDERTGMTDHPGRIALRDNRTDDGSAGSQKVSAEDFIGPIEGLADAGDGPGSGFRLKQATAP